MSNIELFVSVLLAIIIILIATKLIGRLSIYLGQPKVVGEMIAGVLLGPTLFGYYFPDISSTLFNKEIMPSLFILSNISLSIYMFLVGAELDYGIFNKKTVKDSSLLAIVGLVFPFFAGMGLGYIYYEEMSFSNIDKTLFAIFMGTGLSITAFPMLARILDERNLTKTKLGTVALLSASFQDVISWILLSFVTSSIVSKNAFQGMIALVGGILFILVVFFVFKPILKKVGERAEREGSLSENAFTTIIILLLISALITDKLGLYSVFGGFLLGLVMPRSATVQKELSSKLKYFSTLILLPIFFTYSGLNTNLRVLGNSDIIMPALVIICVGFASKYVLSLLSMRFSGFSWGEASAVGGLANARGLMDLLIANIGLSYGLIDIDLFSILVLLAVISTLAAMPIFNLSFKINTNTDKHRHKNNSKVEHTIV